MKIMVSLQAHSMLKFVLTTTGETEVDPKGNEINSPLRLKGEESAQRRHYFMLLEPVIEKAERGLQEAGKTHQALVEKEKEKLDKKLSDEEKDKKLNEIVKLVDSFKNLQELRKKLNEEKIELEVTEKTFNVIKKYFKEYSDKIGFMPGDDETAEELNVIFM